MHKRRKRLAVLFGVDLPLRREMVRNLSVRGVDSLVVGLYDDITQLSTKKPNCEHVYIRTDSADSKSLRPVKEKVGNRIVDYILIAPKETAKKSVLKGMSYDEWRNSLCNHMEIPLFMTLQLLSKLIPTSRVLFLLDRGAYMPLMEKGIYSISQYALRMAINVLSTEMPDALIGTAFIDDEEASNVTPLQKHLGLNDAISRAQKAKFLSWLFMEVRKTSFVENHWDISDQRLKSIWSNAKLSH